MYAGNVAGIMERATLAEKSCPHCASALEYQNSEPLGALFDADYYFGDNYGTFFCGECHQMFAFSQICP